MVLNIVEEVILFLSLIASIVTLVTIVVAIATTDDDYERKKAFKISYWSFFVAVPLFVLYFKFNRVPGVIPPEPKINIIKASLPGKYVGRFTDENGKELPTFLMINPNGIFKNYKLSFRSVDSHSWEWFADFIEEDNSIYIHDVGIAHLRIVDGIFILESPKEFEYQWTFSRVMDTE